MDKRPKKNGKNKSSCRLKKILCVACFVLYNVTTQGLESQGITINVNTSIQQISNY